MAGCRRPPARCITAQSRFSGLALAQLSVWGTLRWSKWVWKLGFGPLCRGFRSDFRHYGLPGTRPDGRAALAPRPAAGLARRVLRQPPGRRAARRRRLASGDRRRPGRAMARARCARERTAGQKPAVECRSALRALFVGSKGQQHAVDRPARRLPSCAVLESDSPPRLGVDRRLVRVASICSLCLRGHA